jgi:hypothetical protein
MGASVLGLGVSALSWLLAVIGASLLLMGTVASLHGGVLYDAVPRADLGKELRQVRDGDVHQGVAPSDRITSPPARKDAVESNEVTRGLEAAGNQPTSVPWAPAAGWLLLLVTAGLTVSQWELVSPNATGRSNSFRDAGLAILLGLAGLRLVVAPGRHSIATGITLLAGLGLVFGGVLARHTHRGLTVVEVGAGTIAILCSLIAWTSPTGSHDVTPQ